GISDQPLDMESTKKGAMNRARNAKKLNADADFWFGLEGGLHDWGEGYHLVTYAVLIDKEGNEFVGEGEEIHLPIEVSDKVKKGEWFGDVIREYAKTHKIDQNLITRLSPFTQAVQNAYANYLKIKEELGFRKKSLGIVVDDDNNFLLVQLSGYGSDDWNFPGGGVEENETEEEAIKRELREELGTNKFEITGKSKKSINYEWPDFVVAERLKKNGKTYKGQSMATFLVRFIGEKDDIKPGPGEIREIKWVKYNQLKDHLNFPNQWGEVEKALKELWKGK
ncbi:MAG: DUF84 family protein, partial [Patescibacteria group bacterium]